MVLLDYVENKNRCFYVQGIIDDELKRNLVPEINGLRLESNEPITIYIDSPGGDINIADFLVSLAKAPDPNGNTRELVTVAIGTCASAAADLLIRGDHAIVYPHAQIIYHGTRQTSRRPLTYEDATNLASDLHVTNEQFAQRLAKKILIRIFFPLSQLNSFADFKKSKTSNITQLINELSGKLITSKRLVEAAHLKCLEIVQITEAAIKRTGKKWMAEGLEFESAILKAIVARRVTRHRKEPGWTLGDRGLDQIVRDFQAFEDYIFGDHNNHTWFNISTYGKFLLNQDDSKECEQLSSTLSETDLDTWIHDRSGMKLRRLWYFCISLARTLQTADYYISPEDAFWLGLVDEVPGSEIAPLRRVIAEIPA
jgi:ATP-dependent protease ClpP protease subunit